MPTLDCTYMEKIGDWYFHTPVIFSPYGIGLYVWDSGDIYTLKEANEDGIIQNLSPVLQFANSNYRIYTPGDVNEDFTLNVADATVAQKYLAGIETNIIFENIRSDIMDFNKDDIINIKDATSIQKHIAGLSY